MVDEKGRDEKSNMQMVEEGQKKKMRASHFRSVSKTISVPKYLGHRCD
jgi:hypothetical protein